MGARLRFWVLAGFLGCATLAAAAPMPHPSSLKAKATVRPLVNARDGAELVTIPAGEYVAANLHRKTPEKRTLAAFIVYRYLVTVAQYQRFCDATDRKLPPQPEWKQRDGVNTLFPERWFRGEALAPVLNVPWNDAAAYARWAGGSLTSDAQWEKAAWGTIGPEKGFESPFGVEDLRVPVRQWCEFNPEDRPASEVQRLLKPGVELHSIRGAYGPFDPNPWEHSAITRGIHGHAFRCVVSSPDQLK